MYVVSCSNIKQWEAWIKFCKTCIYVLKYIYAEIRNEDELYFSIKSNLISMI